MKKLLNYTPVYFLFCLIIGILLQFYLQIWRYDFTYFLGFVSFFIFILFFLKQKKLKTYFTVLSSFTFILVGGINVFIQNPKNYNKHYTKHYLQDDSVTLTIQKILKPSNYYTKYFASVSQVGQQKTIGNILLNIKKDSTLKPLRINQQVYLNPEFKELISPLNPHQFNYKNYLTKQHIYHQIFTKKGKFKILKSSVSSLTGLSASIRNKIQFALKKHSFSKDEYAVISALLLGQRQNISKELLEDYTNAGAIHILAISGLHIGVLLWIFSLLLKPIEKFKYGKQIKTTLIVFLLWSFAFIAGLSASVVRAVTMFSFVAIALTLNRKQHIEHSLITSMLILLLVNPLFLFDVGFQLSYLAVFGIVWVQPLLYSIWKPKFILFNKIWQLCTVSIAAQTGILPICLYYFNQFPSLFIISNLLIIPALGSILIGGILIIVLALTNLLPQYIVDIYGNIISSMNSVVEWIANQEGFLLKDINLSFSQMIIWYLFIILTYQFIISRKTKRLVYILISIVVLQLLNIAEIHFRNTKKEFIVFHKNKASFIGLRNGKHLSVYNNSRNDTSTYKPFNSYKTHENLEVKIQETIPNIFKFNNEMILIVDSLGVYNLSLSKPIIVLQNSPKINLKRLIDVLNPKQIIADGSNYKSYITQWKKTCEQKRTPFYSTSKNGAYIMNY